MELFEYISNYFSNWQHRFFWGMILIFSLYDCLKNAWKKRNYIKLWMRDHNIGRKYK